jgi:hypothetical protein
MELEETLVTVLQQNSSLTEIPELLAPGAKLIW